jgi:glutathione synthase
VRIGIVLSNPRNAAPTHTTVHLAHAAVAAGHAVRVFAAADLEIDSRGRLIGVASALQPGAAPTREALVAGLVNGDLPRRTVQLDDLDVLLLRANPLDANLLALAMVAEDAGVRVLNPPAAILRTANKAWLATLADVPRPETVVTRALPTLARFADGQRGGVVVKPARGCGGRDVSFVRRASPRALGDALARIESHGVHAVAQAWLPEAAQGEKRLLWLDGRVIGGYLRIRAPGELRHNLKVGGQPHPTTLDEDDARIAATLGPHLRRAGVWLAGIDVIGGRVVEVNTLNPGGAHYTSLLHGVDVAAALVEHLAAPSSHGSPHGDQVLRVG